jgi:DNA-binding IclR family transcriptional regulator
MEVLRVLGVSPHAMLASQIADELEISPREAGSACRMLRAHGLVEEAGRGYNARLWKLAEPMEVQN